MPNAHILNIVVVDGFSDLSKALKTKAKVLILISVFRDTSVSPLGLIYTN